MHRVLRVLTVAAGLLASGCAYVEWPPKGSQPAAPPPSQQAESSRVFVGAEAVTAGKGDSVHGLAKRHGVSARAIIDANGLKPPYALQVGQRLVLPRDREHVVKKGEGLYSIARFHNVDAYEMARLNGLEKPFKLLAGQQLRIPGTGTALVADAAPPPTAQPVPRVEGVTLEVPKDPTPRATPGAMEPEALPPPSAAPPPPAPPPQAAEAAPPPSLPDPPLPSGTGYLWPVKGNVLSAYGPKEKGLQNDGINIAAPAGTPVRAAQDGVVAYVGNELRGFGNLVLVKHGDGHMTAYAHASEILVKKGDSVGRGQTIARVGTSGGVKEPQLHFEVRKGKHPVDPMRFLGSA